MKLVLFLAFVTPIASMMRRNGGGRHKARPLLRIPS
jgi:hypothetical protein